MKFIASQRGTRDEGEPRWRVGSKIPLNVYEGNRPVCQCHTALDARRIITAMNRELDTACKQQRA